VPGGKRLPIGTVYEPSAFTWMRRIFPRRSLVFWAVRRASTCGALKRPALLSMSLNGEKPPELPPPAGVSSPVTSQRLLAESNAMSPATWQQAPRLFGTRRICCSEARSRCAGSLAVASTNLKRESWK
jgi:hypothetical protein